MLIVWRCLSRTRSSSQLLLLRRSVWDMAAERKYEEAIRALNSLQTNASVLEELRSKSQTSRESRNRDSLPGFARHLNRMGIQVDDLDELSVIHVSGTKGKGSTCAFCESILRHSGYKTGLFTSPHLVEVRERIRINGKPLSRMAFSDYFWQCFKKFEETKEEHHGRMPSYFRFLTALSFHVFLREKVDVAILEVGIGGTYDCTNIVRKPIVCGIASLGMDHIRILGDTIEQIAWHKAGIFKRGVPAFTINQEAGGMDVIAERASELGTSVRVVPKLVEYPGPLPELGLAGEHQQLNATLAIQLCHTWIAHKSQQRQRTENGDKDDDDDNDDDDGEISQLERAPVFDLPSSFRTGLKDCRWLGRAQVIERPAVTLYLDGAHTVRSVRACVKWFQTTSQKQFSSPTGVKVVQVLLFNCMGRRDPLPLLSEIQPLNISYALFCPNIASLEKEHFEDQTSLNTTHEADVSVCRENETTWLSLMSSKSTTTYVFDCVLDCLIWLFNGRDPALPSDDRRKAWPALPDELAHAHHIQLLVTGSFRLMGATLKALGPKIVQVVPPDDEIE
ncbi:folylpolyglutamate synthase, mitochondrial-like [Oscarella lobularis]|uniref:folylpolyglutamate synthase, mitochondrial-like n=1 Tax=Oscarella lobularis TaxID=121494 RepID=UPI003313EC34